MLGFFLLILILAFVFGDRGIIEIIKTQKQIKALQQTIKELEAEKHQIEQGDRAAAGKPAGPGKKGARKTMADEKKRKSDRPG